ncbi:ABC transporter substrate-binding protein [Gemmatimonadota bacterium]
MDHGAGIRTGTDPPPPLNGGGLQPEPGLIRPTDGFYESENNEFNFILSDGITFHDGTPLTVGHIKGTYDLFKRLAPLEHAEVDPAFAYIDTIRVVPEDKRIIIVMPPGMREQVWRIAATAPLHDDFLDAAASGSGDPWYEIVRTAEGVSHGLGAYNFIFDAERRIIQLLEYRQYFGGRPSIRQISVHLFSNDRELIPAFITGAVQFVRLPTYKSLMDIMSEAEGSGLSGSEGESLVRWYPRPDHFFYLAFNTTKEPLDIPEMRRALTFAIKRTELGFRDEMPGASAITDVPLHPDSRLGQMSPRARPYSPRATALRLIREISTISRTRTGYPRNEDNEKYSLTLIYPDHVSHYETLARRIKINLDNLEFQINVTPLAPQELRDRIYDGDYDLAISEMTLPPTVESIQRLFWSRNVRNGINFTRYINEEFDEAIQGAIAKLQGQRAVYNYRTYTRNYIALLYNEVPLLPLFFQANQYYFFNTRILDQAQLGPIGGRLAPMSDWRLK